MVESVKNTFKILFNYLSITHHRIPSLFFCRGSVLTTYNKRNFLKHNILNQEIKENYIFNKIKIFVILIYKFNISEVMYPYRKSKRCWESNNSIMLEFNEFISQTFRDFSQTLLFLFSFFNYAKILHIFNLIFK